MKIFKIIWSAILFFIKGLSYIPKRALFDFDYNFFQLEMFIKDHNMSDLDNQVIFYKKLKKLEDHAVSESDRKSLNGLKIAIYNQVGNIK